MLHRLKRLPGSPHSIAAGFASGAAVSFTPFLGFHFLLGFVVAFFTRGNYVAAAVGTVVGNPWTFPFIFAWTYHLGRAIVGDADAATLRVADLSATGFFSEMGSYVVPMVVGSVPTMIVVWVLIYWPLRRLVSAFQAARRRRREARLRELRAARLATDHPGSTISD